MDSQNPTVFGSLWAGALVLFEFYTDDASNLLPGYFAVRSGSFLAESIVSLSRFWCYQQHSLQHAELKPQFECFAVCDNEVFFCCPGFFGFQH